MSEGTIALQNKSDKITGTDTKFSEEVSAGDFIVFTAGNVIYTLAIKTVESDKYLTLARAYTGPTTSGAGWDAVKMGTMSQITMSVVDQVTEALRGLNADKKNWQQIFSSADDIVITLPDNTTYSGPSWLKISTILNTTDLDKLGAIADRVNADSTAAAEAKDAAGSSATAAAASESNAAASAADAAAHETNAATSETNAAASEASAKDYAAQAKEDAAAAAAANPDKCLQISKNLSDVEDKAQAIKNLLDSKPLTLVADAIGQYDAVTLKQLQAASGGGTGANLNGVMNNFIGAVDWFNGSRALLPSSYIPSDGQELKRADYPDLWAAIESGMLSSVTDELWLNAGGTDFEIILNRGKYSTGDGSTTFRVPDLNGFDTLTPSALFLRGSGKGANGNPGDVFVNGAPNITGKVLFHGADQPSIINAALGTNGSISPDNIFTGSYRTPVELTLRTGASSAGSISLDASKSSPIYGRSSGEVRPNAVTGIWIIRAKGSFTAADTNFNVITSDEELPANGTVVRGGAVQSVYRAAGKTHASAALQAKDTIGGDVVPELTAINASGTVKNYPLPAQAGELVAKDSDGALRNTTGDVQAIGAAVVGVKDGIAMSMRPQTEGGQYYLSGRSSTNTAEWSFGKLTANSNDVSWNGMSNNHIILKGAGGVQIDGGVTSNGSVTVNGGIEIYASSRCFIDFHNDNTTADYSHRFITQDARTLELTTNQTYGIFRVAGGYACRLGQTGSYSGGHLFNFEWDGSSRLGAWIDASRVGYVTMTSASDRLLKRDIAYVSDDDALNQVMEWRPATFKYKARGVIGESGELLGFIANDLVDVSPECVKGEGLQEGYDENAPEGAYELDQVAMIAKLTIAIQQQQKEIEKLKKELSDLKNKA